MSILNRPRGMLGKQPKENRDKIVDYLFNQTTEGWDEIHGLLVDSRHTIWQGVIKIDASFTDIGKKVRFNPETKESKVIENWKKIPDALLVMRAIKTLLAICLVFFPLVALANDYQVHENYVPKQGEYYRPRDDKLQKYENFVPSPGNFLRKRDDKLQSNENYTPKHGSYYKLNGLETNGKNLKIIYQFLEII